MQIPLILILTSLYLITYTNDAEGNNNQLAGIWRDGCTVDSSGATATSTELEISGSEISQSHITYFSNTCSGERSITRVLKGSFVTSGVTSTVSGVALSHVDINFEKASVFATRALHDWFGSRGTTLEKVLASRGIVADNLTVTQFVPSAKIFTVYRQEGNTLHLGVSPGRNDTPEKRFMELNTLFTRIGGAPEIPLPATVAEHSGSLASENAKIPDANRPVSSVQRLIHRLSALPPYSTRVPKMMMTFPNGYSTHCMDWDLLNESPTPGSIGDRCELTNEPQEDTLLKPFQAGERINASFGSLTARGFQVPNVVNSSLIKQGELVMNDAGQIGISSSTFSNIQSGGSSGVARGSSGIVGTYYLDGYTITIKTSDGEIRHQYIGVLTRRNGSVTSLMLGNEFFSKGR